MSEPQPVEFRERIRRPLLSGTAARGGIVLGSALLFTIGIMSVMGASPSPATGADPCRAPHRSTHRQPRSTPTTAPPSRGAREILGGGPGFGFGFGRTAVGIGIGFGGVTITAIDGSNLSLKTDDGWTRTIAVTSDTKITRADKTIAVGDLKVGDEITFRQTRRRRHLHDHGDPPRAPDGGRSGHQGRRVHDHGQAFGGTTQTIHVDSSRRIGSPASTSPTCRT